MKLGKISTFNPNLIVGIGFYYKLSVSSNCTLNLDKCCNFQLKKYCNLFYMVDFVWKLVKKSILISIRRIIKHIFGM